MILLSDEARGDYMLRHFAPEFIPTHALCISSNVASAGDGTLAATYWFGLLNADGTFEHLESVPGQSVQLPRVRDAIQVADSFKSDDMRPVAVTRDDMRTILRNLLDADVVPDAKDPRIPVPRPGKLRGDWKLRDLDAIAAFVEPRLKGVVVA